MKKIIFICLGLALVACGDDFSEEYSDKNLVAETPLDGMKIKLIESRESQGSATSSTIEFYYNANGFIDSIHANRNYIQVEKFIYNDLNQIIELRYNRKNSNESDYSVANVTYYEYNELNQIVSLKKYNKNNVLYEIESYTYNPDGTLYNPVKIVENENLIKYNTYGNYNTYTFDSHINPYYNIYPKAYKVLNYINKNNVKTRKLRTMYQTMDWSHELSYNDDNYLSYEVIRDYYQYKYQYNNYHYYP